MKKLILLSLLAILMAGCHQQAGLRVHSTVDMTGLASPVRLQPDSTIIFLEDYFLDVTRIDSVVIHSKNLPLGPENKTLTYFSEASDKPAMEMKVWIDGLPYSVPVLQSRKRLHTFSFNPQGKTYTSVCIKGSLNGWNPSATPLVLKDTLWQTTVVLNPGIYQYLIVADGQEFLDPANPSRIDNNMGGFNSKLVLGSIDDPLSPKLNLTGTEDDELILAVENPVEDFLVFWDNYRLDNEYPGIEDDELEVSLPAAARQKQRSFVRAWAYNLHGISNDVLIPLEYGRVVRDPAMLSRSDKHGMIIYNIMIDRFYNGDTMNDFPVPDPEIHPKANYFGGDITGITKKAEEGFFNALGVNTLWISPVVLNPEGAWGLYPNPRTKFSGYHGYWPVSFTKVDYRYGTEEDLKILIQSLHGKNNNILLDFNAHHIHLEHPQYKLHPDWTTDLYLPDGTLNTEKWDEHRLTTWFDVFLPTLNLARPEVYEMLSDSAVYWIKEYRLDGFRHDASKHVPEIFWRTLTMKLKQQVIIPENRDIYQIGETYGNGDLIGSYVSSGKMDGQFDFNVYDAAIAVFGKEAEPFERLDNTLKESFMYYGYHNLMGYISGNQDRPRFISLAGGSLDWGEDGKYAGWTREITVGDPVAYKRMAQLMAFNMTIPGVPVIFYGDEVGMPGANDPDNRRWMKFENLTGEEMNLQETVVKLITIRKANLEFLYGDFRTLLVNGTSYAYARMYLDRASIVVFNKSADPQSIQVKLPAQMAGKDLKSIFGSSVRVSGDTLSVRINPSSFEIITINR